MSTFYNLITIIIFTTIISFFVAFVINSVVVVMNGIKKKKLERKIINDHDAQNMELLQKDAGGTTRENEVEAAIGLALHLYLEEQKGIEDFKLTIQKVIKPYSPWSSKIYGLNKFPK